MLPEPTAHGSERDRLDRLLATARRVAESLDLETVLTSIVTDATALLGADSGDMLLWDRERDMLRVVAVANFPPEMLGFELAFGEGLSSQAILGRRTIQVDRYETYEHRATALEHYEFGAVLCAPLIVQGTAIGAINVHAGGDQHRFPADGADLLAAFAGHAAIAIDHARRYENEVRLGRDLAAMNRDLTRSLTVQQRLAEAVLADAGPAGIAAVLAEHLDRQVVIQDHLHRPIAGAAPGGGEAWRGLLEADGPDRPPITNAVRVGSDVVGYLLLSADAELGPTDRALVDVATTGVALEFAKERAAAEVEERLRGEAAADLLTGAFASEETIAARTARLGYDLAEPRDVMVLHVADAANLHPLLLQLRERLASRAPRSIAIVHGGEIAILAGARRGAGADVRALAQDLVTSLGETVGGDRVTVAIGDRCIRPDEYAPAYERARESLELMLKLGRTGVIGSSELGPYALLLKASSRGDLQAFAERSLLPIVEHDRARGSELLVTLRAYLEEDRSQRRVAERCVIHVNTVVYRIRRIEELLKVDLADPTTVFDLTLAVRIRDLLGDGARLRA